jgi:hypothetical protein
LANPDWIDTVVVDMFLAGRDTRALTPAEQAAAARRLLARGESRNQVVKRLRTRHDRLQQILDAHPERKAHR